MASKNRKGSDPLSPLSQDSAAFNAAINTRPRQASLFPGGPGQQARDAVPEDVELLMANLRSPVSAVEAGSGARRSLANILFRRRRQSKDGNKATSDAEYEMLCPKLTGVPSDVDPEEARNAADDFDRFFRSRAIKSDEEGHHASELGFLATDHDWAPPESWAVEHQLQPKLPSKPKVEPQPPTVFESIDHPWPIRIYKPADRFTGESSGRSNSTGGYGSSAYSYLTVLCNPTITAAELCSILQTRFASKMDLTRFRLFVIHGGSERRLLDNDRPLLMLRDWLLEMGYRDYDQFYRILRGDNCCYVARFVFHEYPPAPPVSSRYELDESESVIFEPGRPKITKTAAFLAGENLSVLPVSVFMNAETIEFADFSRNTLLSLPDDLFAQFVSLKLLRLSGNLLSLVPPAVCLAQSLSHLDLSKNLLSGPELAALSCCSNLTHLYLSGNSITMLPDELSKLTRLHLIDLSNNYLEHVPSVLFGLTSLRELDVSFNRIRELPDDLISLTNLMALVSVGNLISRVSPKVAVLPGLRFIDIRGSAIDNLDSAFKLPVISEVHAAYSGLRKIEIHQESSTLTQLVAHHNVIGEMQVTAMMGHLRVLNLAVCRLLILPESLFEHMPKLEELILDRNKLQSLPGSIAHLHRLHHLSASDNAIDTFPRLPYAECSHLRSINLRGNNINEFPVGLWSLPALEHLNLSSNFISVIPAPPVDQPPLARSLLELYIAENKLKGEQIDHFGCLSNLEVLNISFNEVYELANCLFDLRNLRELYASACFLAQLNERIENLVGLKILMLNGNNFANVPGELCKVTALSVLDLSSNNLRYNVLNHPYDWNWNFNPNLQYLNLSNNRRLDIFPKQAVGKLAPNEPDLTEFSSLQKLRLLDYANVGSQQRQFKPSVSLRIRDAPPAGSLRMSVGEFCGRRVIFDQVDLVLPNYLEHENDYLIGLFDGCGDEFVPIFVRERLPVHLREELSRLQPDESFDEAIRRAFLQTGHELSEQPIQGDNGAVGTILYLLGHELYIANVGNTMAIMSREGNPVILTNKHHAWSREEIDRIRSLGGYIAPCGRVERELAITRAFGYHHLLPYVNAEPSIKRIEISRLDEFIILASASVWKFIRYQMAIDIVRGERGDLDFAVKRLRDTALAYGATDSMTIMVIDLRTLQRGSLSSNDAVAAAAAESNRRRRVFRSDTEDQSLARLEAEPDPPVPPFCMVFTDIRESSPLWQHNPNAMFAANKLHHELMRRSARNYGGYEIKSEGDSLFVVFQTVSAAIRWCQAVQLQLLQADWPVEILEHELCAPVYGEQGELLYRGLWVRMGVHFGDPLPDRDKQHARTDFQGPDVIRCARIMNNALGGEILLTTDAYRALQSDPGFKEEGIDMEFYSIGPMVLKGLHPDTNPIYSAYPKQVAGRFRSRLMRLEEATK